MRITNSRPLRAAGATITALGLILGLGACSSGASTEQFCTDAKAFMDVELDDSEDPEDIMAATLEKLDKIEAPDEIKDDWDYVSQASKDMLATFNDIDMTDMDAVIEAQEEIEEKYDEEKLQTSGDKVDEFMKKECGIEVQE